MLVAPLSYLGWPGRPEIHEAGARAVSRIGRDALALLPPDDAAVGA
jgi:hypothetical protein